MRLSRFLLAASVWVLCVLTVGTLAWFAIDSAGRQVSVLTTDASPIGAVGAPAPSRPAAPDDGVLSATPQPPVAGTASPTVRPTLGDAVAVSPDPQTSSTSRRPRTRSTTSSGNDPRILPPTSSSSPTWPRPRPTTESANSVTEFTRGGSATFTCDRDDPMDYVIKPAQGWRGSGKPSGPNEVEVVFVRGEEDVHVHAVCEDGRPKTEVDDHHHTP